MTYLLYEEHNRKTWSESLREINQAFSENFFKHEVLTFDEAKKLSEIYRGCSEDNEFQGKVISSDQAKEIFDEDVLITNNISEGNSGGPLIDNEGKVVGIVTWGSDNDREQFNGARSLDTFCMKIVKCEYEFEGEGTWYDYKD